MTRYFYQDQLESERLKTKWLTLEDISLWAPFFDDPESIAFVPAFNLPTSEEKARFWIEKQLERYEDKRFGLQALIEKKTGELVGLCGLLTQEVDGASELEVGYHILRKHWGKGYAPEAAKLFIEYAFENSLAQSVISIIDVKNVKSQRVAEKNGLRRGVATCWNGLDIYVYRTEERFMLPAVAALIEGISDGKPALLIQKRCKTASEGTNVYEIPGGKIRAGEQIFNCLRREVKEETGLDVTWIEGEKESLSKCHCSHGFDTIAYEPFGSVQNTAGRYPVMVQAFICKAEGKPSAFTEESEEIHWVKLEELASQLELQSQNFFAMHVALLKKYLKHKGF